MPGCCTTTFLWLLSRPEIYFDLSINDCPLLTTNCANKLNLLKGIKDRAILVLLFGHPYQPQKAGLLIMLKFHPTLGSIPASRWPRSNTSQAGSHPRSVRRRNKFEPAIPERSVLASCHKILPGRLFLSARIVGLRWGFKLDLSRTPLGWGRKDDFWDLLEDFEASRLRAGWIPPQQSNNCG